MDCIWEVGKTYRTSVQGVTARIRKSNYLYVYGTLDFEPENAPMRKWCARTGYSAERGGENGLAFPRIQLTRGRGCEVDGGDGGGSNGMGGEAASGEWGSASDTQEKLLKLVAQLEKELAAKNEVRRVVNDDGTETLHGLPVTIPSTLVPDNETPVEVRSRKLIAGGRRIGLAGDLRTGPEDATGESGGLRIVLADKPTPITWTPPASLPDGEYVTRGSWLYNADGDCICHRTKGSKVWSDWTPLPLNGRYRKVGNVATWLGE